MPDLQLLLEFEDSLSGSSDGHGTETLLRSLQTKIQWARLHQSDIGLDSSNFAALDIAILYREYRFSDDEFHSCTKCGRQLCAPDSHQQCCLNYMDTSLLGTNSLSTNFYARLILNPVTTITQLPHYTEFLCLQQGIPNQLRGKIWSSLLLLGALCIPQTTSWVFDSFQHSYSPEISKQISKDLTRTFPTISFFRLTTVMADLELILNVYANYDAELGYCQGLLFLVGVLYYNLGQDCPLTLHALINAMETEPQLRAIFVASSMQRMLTQWRNEFSLILQKADPALHLHLEGFVDLNIFLPQWWMSFMSSHTPDLLIVNRVMDFCIFQGWKIGMFKISLGLLVTNRHILITLGEGDEDVAYQLLLNESRWGPVMGHLDVFFGNLLFSWDEQLFVLDDPVPISPTSSLMGMTILTLSSSSVLISSKPEAKFLKALKHLSLTRIDRSSSLTIDETQSVFSGNHAPTPEPDSGSLYSQVTDYNNGTSDRDYCTLIEHDHSEPRNTVLEELLRQAYFLLDDKSVACAALKETIANTIHLE